MKKKEKPELKKAFTRKVTPGEARAGALIIVVLMLIVLWVRAQRNSYDPDERDIPARLLSDVTKKAELYKTPLKKLSETGGNQEIKRGSLGPFPVSILDGGWELKSGIRSFSPSTLYVKINGEADKFLKEGFRSLSYGVIGNRTGREELSIELYDQGEEKGSIAVFSEYASGSGKIKKSGRSLFITTSAGAIGRSGRFFYRILGNYESGPVRRKAEEVAGAMSLLPDGKKPPAAGYRILNEGMRIEAGRIEYTGSNVFQLSFARDFWFGKPDTGKPERLFIHQAKTVDDARAVFKKIIEAQAADYKVLDRDEERALMEHLFLKNFFAMELKGRFIYGIENSRDKNRTAGMLKKFSGALRNEK